MRRLYSIAIVLIGQAVSILAQYAAPSGFYSAAQGLTGASLKATLHDLIDGHTVVPETASSTDAWDALQLLEEDPPNTSNVILLYTGNSAPKLDTNGNGNPDITSDSWEREHLWPRSRGVEATGPDGSDLFNLRACSRSANSARGNRFFGEPSLTHPTDPATHPPSVPGVWYDYAGLQGGLWEPLPEEKGDIARALFYMAVRYDGSDLATTDLELTDALTDGTTMAILSTLLAWHAEDPVSEIERRRNHLIYTDFQYNRNPFVDHPEWATVVFLVPGAGDPILLLSALDNQVFENDASVPITVSILEPLAENLTITLNSSDSDSLAVPASVVLPAGDLTVSFTADPIIDSSEDGNQTVSIAVSAAGFVGNAVALEVLDVDAVTEEPEGDLVWINEFHYDNASIDSNEFIEVVVSPIFGGEIGDLTIEFYNGNGGTVYDSYGLDAFSIASEVSGYQFLTLDLPPNGIQNGSPDGFAISEFGTLLSFISYEGIITATSGTAIGEISVDIGVREHSGFTENGSLYLTGAGFSLPDFSWNSSKTSNTKGELNLGQVLQPVFVDDPPAFATLFETAAYLGGTYAYTVSATDPDSDELSFALLEGPSWLEIERIGAKSALLSGTPNLTSDLGSPLVTIAVSDGTTEVLQQFALTVGSSLEAWLASFGMASLDPRIDSDSDGWTVLEEYALGGSPIHSDTHLTKIAASGTAVTVETLLRLGDPSLSVTIEGSNNLSAWSAVGVSAADSLDPAPIPEGYTRVEFTIEAQAGFRAVRFKIER